MREPNVDSKFVLTLSISIGSDAIDTMIRLISYILIINDKFYLCSTKTDMQRTQIAKDVTNLFDCDVILATCLALINFLRSQLHTKKVDPQIKSIFNANQYSSDECMLYSNLIFYFINNITKTDSEFSTKMRSLSQESFIAYKKYFESIIPALLDYIKTTRNVNQPSIMHCYHILDHLLELLYSDMLLQVVQSLLSDENKLDVRVKILDLLLKKLDSPESFTDCDDSILSLLGKFWVVCN